MLSEGMPRQTGCPYQTNGVVITSKAEMLYCSPKSPILGNVLKEPPSQIYFSNLWRRRKLIKNDCGNCIHDYHVSPTFIEKVSFYIKSAVRRSKYNLASLVRQATLLRGSRVNIKNISKLESRVVLIVGWYGTETAGDKAILWSIINRLKSRNLKPTRIYLASLEPFICKWTIKEMHLGDVLVVKTYTQDFEKACVDADEIIVGGGPLMDIEALNHILYAFIQGIRHGAVNRIEGCGIGPLSIDRYAQAVRQILRLSHHTTLRDAMSVMRCRDEFTIPNVQEAPDPATDFVKFYAADKIRSSSSNRGFSDNAVSCFLREWTYEYSGRIDHNQFLEIKSSFESELAKLTLYVFRAISAHCIQLLPMHSFYTGGDDRIFNRYMESRIKKDSKSNQGVDVNVANMPMAPSEILESMSNSSFNICMRFHSVLFAENLGVPYVAIDYTMGGKIKAFLEGRNQLYRLISVKDVAHGSWSDKIDNILSGLSA
jgi:polysaccharide pyruvyl transferase WcaK-like protein